MSDTLARITAHIGTDPEQMIEARRQAADHVADVKHKLAKYWALFRGGTASPYDQQRKSLLSQLAEGRREELRNAGEKIREAELETYAHAHEDYKTFLDKCKTSQVKMYELEAELYRAEADVAELDRKLDLVRAMVFWSTSEMRHL